MALLHLRGARPCGSALVAMLAIMMTWPVNATDHIRSTNRAPQRPNAAVDGRRKPPTPPSQQQWESLNAQAIEAHRAGDYIRGTPLAEAALRLARQTFGDRAPLTLTSLNNLAALYDAQGRYAEAEPLYREALQIRREVLGPRHPDTLTSLNNLAVDYGSQGRYGEAEPLLQELLQGRREVLGPRHPDTLAGLLDLGFIYQTQRRYGEAEPLYRETLQAMREVLGPRHPDTLKGLNNLAFVYEAEGRYGEAEPLFRELLDARREVLGPRHPDTLTSLNELAALYNAQGRYAEAEPLYREALQGRLEVLGLRHPDTLTSLNDLAILNQAQEAAHSIQEADHLSARVTELYGQGRYREAIPLAQRAQAINEKVLGAEHPQTASALNNLAELYEATGLYADAAELYQRVLQITERRFGEDDLKTALALQHLAAVCLTGGLPDKAVAFYTRRARIYLKARGAEDLETVAAMNDTGTALMAANRYDDARKVLDAVLQIRTKALGPDHPDTADVRAVLGSIDLQNGDFADAQISLSRALTALEKARGPWDGTLVKVLLDLGRALEAAGSVPQAQQRVERALAISEKVFGPDTMETAGLHSALAHIHFVQGDYPEARRRYERALAINEQASGPDHPQTAVCLNNLARFLTETGDYRAAEPLFTRALRIIEKVFRQDSAETATALNNLAILYNLTGANAKARPLFMRALEINEKVYGPNHAMTLKALENVVVFLVKIGDYATARPLLERAIERTRDAKLENVLDTAKWFENVFAIAVDAGDAAGAAYAEPFEQQLLALKEKLLGREHPEVALSLNSLATYYRNTDQHSRAAPLYQRAIAIRDQALGRDHPDTSVMLRNFAALYQADGAYDKTQELMERAQLIDEINTVRFLLSGAEGRKRDYLEGRYTAVEAEVEFSLVAPGRAAKELGITGVLQYKGRALDAMAGIVTLLRRSGDPKDQALFDELVAVAQQLSTLTFRGPGNLSAQAHRERLDGLAREQERLEGELSARSAVFRQALAPVTLEGVRQGLPADTALVEWFRYQPFDPKAKDEKPRWGAPRYVAYVLRRDGEPAVFDLGAAQDIDKLVVDFRAALSDPARTSYKEAAQELFGKLIKPLQSSLSGINRLLLSPDGELNLVPFAALMDEHGEYVAQGFELTYLTSGRDLLSLAAQEPARSRPVVMADPDYGQSTSGPPRDMGSYRSIDLDRSGLAFKPLDGTADEAKALLTGANATEEKLKGLHGPRILHVATHGFFLSDQQVAAAALQPVSFGAEAPPLPLGENPLLRSGLALAGANTRRSGESDDGILTAAEAAQLDLRGTQLVVLSACETGLGQVQQGEGVYGLRRALVLAGAQAQLVSLWRVADDQTQALMVDYYERLLKGAGRSAALREAQKAMIANAATQHPYYWAAFVPIGNWMPIETKGLAKPQ
jgi:CHAT domain-containing protein/Tfp pilus assembly protein PilF